MSHPVLDRAYRANAESGVPAHIVVVAGPGADDCHPPTAAGALPILGVTMHAQPRPGRHVTVRRMGIAPVIAAGPIARGMRVAVADTTGRVRAAAPPHHDTGNEGANNALRFTWRDPRLYTPATRLALVNPGAAEELHWEWDGPTLRLILAHSGTAITTTAAALAAFVAADPVLGRLLAVTHRGASNGTGLLAAASTLAANPADIAGAIGIAEEDALQAGDVIDILLTH
jgi:hypothetical protein